MNKYKFFDKTKLKALILSGVTLLSTVACGKSSVEKPTPGSSVTIETEDNTEKTTKTKLEQNVGKEYQKLEQNGNQTTNYYEDNTEYDNNYVDNNEDPTEERTESKTEEKTEAKTESKTEAKTTSKIIPIIGGHKVQGSYEPTPTTTKIKNSDIKVTTTKVTTQKPTTTKKVTTTKKPVTTTVKVTEPPVVTQPPRTDYNKYDLLDSDPAVAAAAYKKLGDELWEELTNKQNYFFNYGLSNGYAESYVMLAILNNNQGISPEVLAQDDILGRYSLEEIKNYSQWIELELIEEAYGTRVDYSKYMIDEDFANFISRTNEAWKNYQNGDAEEYQNIVRDFYSNEYGTNFIKDIFVNSTDANRYDSSPSTVESFEDDMNNYYTNVVEPMYYNYQQYIGKSYNR